MRRYGGEYDAGYGERGRAGRGRRSARDAAAAAALDRQRREELRFQEERAAPGEGLGWDAPETPRGGAWNGSRGFSWQPDATPTAGELMTEDPAAVTPETSLADAARTMRELDVGILPVVEDREGRRLLGVITDRDITVRAVARGKGPDARVADCMSPGVEACHPDDRVRDLIHVMERARVRRVPIVDHAGSLVGIVAQADLAVDFARGEDRRASRVETAMERISAPARPRGRESR